MIALTPVELYNLLRPKLGDKEAQALTDYISSETGQTVQERLTVFESGMRKDFDALRTENKLDLARVAAELRTEIKDAKADVLKWMFAMFAPFYIGMIVFLIKYFS